MKGRLKLAAGVAALAAVSVAGTVAVAGGGNSIREELSGYQEDPMVFSTTGNGSFKAHINERTHEISYQLRYAALEGNVLQAHIHLGGRHQSGGIIVFLCTNLGNGPAGTQACPPAPATVSGTLTPADVIGPAGQGITAGQFGEFVDAIRAGVTYANVHSSLYQGGEIRAQLRDRDHDRDD
jgi:CHRD domain